jgi:glutaredoxin 2
MLGLGRGRQTYVRRQPEQTILHRVVREHIETFLAEARRRGGGEGLPRFVERELREFLTCGVMARRGGSRRRHPKRSAV